MILSSIDVWSLWALLVEPGHEVGQPVENSAADLEAARADALATPPAQGGDGGAQELGGLADGEQFIFVVQDDVLSDWR